jgi:DNA-binding response OmpR family regulator
MADFVRSVLEKRVLIVEDESRFGTLLASLMESVFATKAQIARNLDQASRCVQDEAPAALVLLDWKLGEADSGEFLAALKQTQPDTPVVVMSVGDYQDWAFKAGCDDYLSKPFGVPEMRHKLGRWLRVN